jgi:branched-chain amino acid transport system substrate-binding protein
MVFILFLFLGSCTFLNQFFTPYSKSSSQTNKKDVPHLGVVMPMSGSFAAFGEECRTSFDLAYSQISSDFEKHLKISFEDSMSTPQGAAQAANKLIHSGAQVVFGEIVSQTSLAIASVTERAQVPLINPGATHEQLTEYSNTLRVCFDDNFQAKVLSAFLFYKLQILSISLLTNSDSDYSVGLSKAIEAEFKKLGGKVLGHVAYQETDIKHITQLKKLEKIGADYVVAPSDYQRMGGILKQAHEVTPQLKIMGTDSWHQESLSQLSGVATKNGYLITTHFSSDEESENVQMFVDAFEKKTGYKPGQVGAVCFDAAQLTFQRLQNYKGSFSDQQSLMNHMIARDSFCGLPGCFHFDEKRNPVKPVYIIETTKKGFRFKEKITLEILNSWFSR